MFQFVHDLLLCFCISLVQQINKKFHAKDKKDPRFWNKNLICSLFKIYCNEIVSSVFDNIMIEKKSQVQPFSKYFLKFLRKTEMFFKFSSFQK